MSMDSDIAGLTAILCALIHAVQKTMDYEESLTFGTDIVGDLVVFQDISPLLQKMKPCARVVQLPLGEDAHYRREQAQYILQTDAVLISVEKALEAIVCIVEKYQQTPAFPSFRNNLWHAVGTYVPHYRREKRN